MKGWIFVVTVDALLLIGILSKGDCLKIPRRNYLLKSTTTCTKYMACKYAMCDWDRTVTINDRTCTFIDNSCRCPPQEICALSDHRTAGSSIFTFHYRCRQPNMIFSSQLRAGKGGTNTRAASSLSFYVGK